MIFYIAISLGEKVLCPLAKNLLRATALSLSVPVQFQFDGPEKVALSTGEVYPQGESLLSTLMSISPDAPIPRVFEDLQQWLGTALPEKTPSDALPLALLLEEVRQQSLFSSSGKQRKEFAPFWDQWRRYYPLPQSFEILGESVINEVNQSEVSDYYQAHNQTSNEVTSINHAAYSLVSTIPADVERILDIGSGPGYVNRHIPADYSVLAMDIEEEILRGNVRQTCVGDIMDIPLADGSVDMVMACDVLEHLPDPVLKKGIVELMRVSRKYIYLQVPLQESSLMAMALCRRCGHVWHINHHKRRYTQQQLIDLLPDNWKPVCVNYTGDMSMLRTGINETEFAEFFGFGIHCIQGAVCPKCGAESVLQGTDDLELLQRMASFDAEFPFPTYTEIGILFCREDQEPHLPNTACPDQEPVERFRNVLSPEECRQALHVYTKAELLPCLYSADCQMTVDEQGYHFHRNETAETAWVAVSFPPLQEPYTGIEITGSLPSGAGTVSVAMSDHSNREHYLLDWQWSRERQTYCLKQETNCSAKYIKLYFQSEELDLYSARLTGGQDVPYRFYPRESRSLFAFALDGVRYQLFYPDEAGISFSHPPQQWLLESNQTIQRRGALLKRFVESMHEESIHEDPEHQEGIAQEDHPKEDETASTHSLLDLMTASLLTEGKLHTNELPSANRSSHTDSVDLRTIVAESLLTEGKILATAPLAASVDSYNTDGMDLQTIVAASIYAESRLSTEDTSVAHRSLRPEGGIDRRGVIASTLFAEYSLAVYQKNTHGKSDLMKMRAVVAARKIENKFQRWLHRHTRVYQILTSLGVKRLYVRLRERGTK